MHGYEIQQVMKRNRFDLWAGILKGSIYHSLKQLGAEGLLKARASDSGRGRVKVVYEMTARGRAELKRLLRGAWVSKARGFAAPLHAAVAFLDELPADEVLELLEVQNAQLTNQLADWRKQQRAGDPSQPIPAHQQLLFDSACQHLETQLRLTQNLKLLLGAYGARKSGLGQL